MRSWGGLFIFPFVFEPTGRLTDSFAFSGRCESMNDMEPLSASLPLFPSRSFHSLWVFMGRKEEVDSKSIREWDWSEGSDGREIETALCPWEEVDREWGNEYVPRRKRIWKRRSRGGVRVFTTGRAVVRIGIITLTPNRTRRRPRESRNLTTSDATLVIEVKRKIFRWVDVGILTWWVGVSKTRTSGYGSRRWTRERIERGVYSKRELCLFGGTIKIC